MARLFANRRTQSGSNRPSTPKASMNVSNRYSCDLRPPCRRHTLFLQGENGVVSFIGCLLLSARPVAVLFGIAFLVVEAVQRVLRGGTRPHVFVERLEGILPLRAHGNAAPSIPAVGGILKISAALVHLIPYRVFGALTHPVFGKVTPSYFLIHFFPEAATAFRVSAAQGTRTNDNAISTGTTTQPARIVAFRSYWLQRCQSPELLIREISKIHRGIIAESGKTRQQNFRGGN